jgi:hypothetical protein
MGIVEGAALLGWRLAQMPKSQALEFLLVSPVRPHWVLLAEASVGMTLLALVTLSGLPILALLVVDGRLEMLDPLVLLVMPFTWGAITGMGLTVWAYEPVGVRRWGERGVIGLILLYLVIGVLAGEHLKQWLDLLPSWLAGCVLDSFVAFHTHNPFGAMRYWFLHTHAFAWPMVIGLEEAGLLVLMLLMARAASRLQGHFHDRHYQPVRDVSRMARPAMGEQPLRWWAVKRVSEYSGRINLWLAGGFGVLYALFLLAGDHWPAWLGCQVFQMCDLVGGVAGITTALILLAAVPAAFQYGLWDSNAQDRCRRLELLLLTRLQGRDYWEAAAAAAWKRGRGYFSVAMLLWLAALIAGRMAPLHIVGTLAAGVLLWAFYFALGFRAFARGLQANGLGMLLTIGLPLGTYALQRLGWPVLAMLAPPGMVYQAHGMAGSLLWLVSPALFAVATLLIAHRSLESCDAQLRRWYDVHHGNKVIS